MALPVFTMKQLMEAGVHFGHHTRRWNPLMTPYVYGVKDKIHIINLNKTAPLLHTGGHSQPAALLQQAQRDPAEPVRLFRQP